MEGREPEPSHTAKQLKEETRLKEELRKQATAEIANRNESLSMQQQACSVIHQHMDGCQQENEALKTQLDSVRVGGEEEIEAQAVFI